MAKVNTYEQNAVHKELSDIVSRISPEQTPFLSLIGASSVSNTVYNWAEDQLRAVGANAQVEGADAGATTHPQLIEHTGYTQIFAGTVNVSGSAAINSIAGKNELARQRMNEAAALKLDMEHAFVGTAQAAAAGTASAARKTGSFQSQLDSSVVTDLAKAAITEDDIADILTTLYENGGTPTMIMCHPRIKRYLSKVLLVDKISDVGNEDKLKVSMGVTRYVGDFGAVDIVPNRLCRYDSTEKVGDILVIDPAMWEVVTYREWKKDPLAKTGDSIREQILCEKGLKNRNFKGSGLLTNVGITKA